MGTCWRCVQKLRMPTLGKWYVQAAPANFSQPFCSQVHDGGLAVHRAVGCKRAESWPRRGLQLSLLVQEHDMKATYPRETQLSGQVVKCMQRLVNATTGHGAPWYFCRYDEKPVLDEFTVRYHLAPMGAPRVSERIHVRLHVFRTGMVQAPVGCVEPYAGVI